jgi:hypothetical protein
MERPEILRREIRALVFDQYGTIVDMQKGLTELAEPFLRAKGWTGSRQQLRHLVAPDALRKLDDRRAVRPRSHAVPADRPSRGVAGDGSMRLQLHPGRGSLAGRRDRDAEALPGRGSRRCIELRSSPDTSWLYCRTATATCWRPRALISAFRSTS